MPISGGWGMFHFTRRERLALTVLTVALCIGAGLNFWQQHRNQDRLQIFESGYAARDTEFLATVVAMEKAAADTIRIDINIADAAALETLPRIGPVLAGRIIEFRKTHGHFKTVEELDHVKGIGPKTLERLRPWVTISPNPD